MRQIYTLLAVCFLLPFVANSQCTDLFFSEYIEGSGNNKALEIYNPTDAGINLGAYGVNLYSNGSATPNNTNSIVLPDTVLPAGAVFVIANTQSDSAAILSQADLTGGPANFNGDDAIALIDTVTGNAIDIIGVIGVREDWEVGTGSTENHTLVRNANINDGETDWTLSALQWDVYPQDSFTFLGSHTINSCDVVVQPPVLSFNASAASVVESEGVASVTVNLSNLTRDVDFEIAVDASSTIDITDVSTTNLGNFSFSEGDDDTSIVINISVTDDMDVEGNETYILTLINVSDSVTVSGDTYTLTILDDDVELNNPCTNLFFSEYIEGSSSNKALEIYNPTNAAIDLGAYSVGLYRNGDSDVGTTLKLPAGFMLAAGDVYVIANSQSDSLILVEADTTSGVTFYNGDDAIALTDTVTGMAIDIIGVIGEVPDGGAWPVGTGSTENFTLVRNMDTREGITNWAASSLTWDVYPEDSLTFLGSHSTISCDTICDNVTISITGVITNEGVLGDEDGAVDITVTGGVEPYTFSWSNTEISEDIENLAGDSYTVVVTDSNGCTGTETFVVAAGEDPCDTVTISITGAVTDEGVLGDEDGAVDITVTGGVEPYTFSWSNSEISEDIEDLAGDSYTVVVTDSNGCTGTETFVVAAGADPCDGVTIDVVLTVTDESVSGAADGAITSAVTGGTEPYTYAWSNSEISEDISGLAPDTYTLIVTDSIGCTGTATETVEAGSVGLNEIVSLRTFNIFPNPMRDVLNVQLQFANRESVQISITDVTGKNVMTLAQEQLVAKTYTLTPNLQAGIYFLSVRVNGNLAVEPFIVK